jgi:hypothetical protein
MNGVLWQSLSALVGATVVYIFGIRQLSIQRRNAFIEKQLSEFYAPIAGYRKRIRTKSELREKISQAANEAWQEKCANDSAAGVMTSQEQFAPYEKIIEYDNLQFREELIPLYRKMLDVFTEKYWLADVDTRAHYQSFLEFVEVWNRFLADAIPTEVVTKLGHAEKNLDLFYKHLEQRISDLQAEVKDLRFWPRI